MSRKLNSITLEWEQFSMKELRTCEQANFYLWVNNHSLEYIGITLTDNVLGEIKQNLNAFKIKNRECLKYYLGYFTYSTFHRYSLKLIKSIEALLIHVNQPVLNTQGKVIYNVSNKYHTQLIVRNKNNPYLKNKCFAIGQKCYPIPNII